MLKTSKILNDTQFLHLLTLKLTELEKRIDYYSTIIEISKTRDPVYQRALKTNLRRKRHLKNLIDSYPELLP